jgi:hypothetical protein
MTRTETAAFTRTAATLVARNDRRAWRRGLLRHLRGSAQRVGIAWSAMVIAAFVLVVLPINMRGA